MAGFAWTLFCRIHVCLCSLASQHIFCRIILGNFLVALLTNRAYPIRMNRKLTKWWWWMNKHIRLEFFLWLLRSVVKLLYEFVGDDANSWRRDGANNVPISSILCRLSNTFFVCLDGSSASRTIIII
jgi:hypothetical protein